MPTAYQRLNQDAQAVQGKNKVSGIVFRGVSKAAVYDVMLFDPRIFADDAGFAHYNAGIPGDAG